MSNSQKWIWKSILVLILIFGGGWIVGAIFNIAALANPALVSQIECPAGTTVKKDWTQQSFDHPGQKTLTLQCLDSSGKPVPTLPDAQISAAEYKLFYTAGVLTMAVIVAVWLIRSSFKGVRAKASAS